MACIAITAFACKKETDSENPVITIIKPTTNFEFEDSVAINFKVEDVDLHEVGFTIVKKGTTDTLYDLPADHTHDNPFVLDEKYKIPVSVHTNATLTVNAEDHNGNMASASVNFHIHPN